MLTDRVKSRVVVVVVVVRKPLFLVMSAICTQIRGHMSEVMTRLSLRYSSTAMLLLEWICSIFPHYLSGKHETYRCSVQLGNLGTG